MCSNAANFNTEWKIITSNSQIHFFVSHLHSLMYPLSLYFIGKPFNCQPLITSAVSNVICCLVFGERFEYHDKQHQCITQNFNEVVRLQAGIWAQVSLLCKQDVACSTLFKIRTYSARPRKSVVYFNNYFVKRFQNDIINSRVN